MRPGRGKSSGRNPVGSRAELDRIVGRVSAETGVPPGEIRAPNKCRRPFDARARAIALAYATDRFATPVLAKYFGYRDHTAVFHAIDRAYERGLT